MNEMSFVLVLPVFTHSVKLIPTHPTFHSGIVGLWVFVAFVLVSLIVATLVYTNNQTINRVGKLHVSYHQGTNEIYLYGGHISLWVGIFCFVESSEFLRSGGYFVLGTI